MVRKFSIGLLFIFIGLGVSLRGLPAHGDTSVVAWGSNNFFGQLDIPPDATNIVGVAAADRYSVILRNDGTVLAWGFSNFSLSNVVAIAAGAAHTLALNADGTVQIAGSSDPSVTNAPPGITDVVAIACGSFHSLVLKSDRTVIAWGRPASATNVPAGLSNVVAVSATGNSSFVLKGDGTVVGWGATYPSNLVEIVAVGGSLDHGIALKQNGTVVAWGNGTEGFAQGLENVIDVKVFPGGLWAIKRDGTLAGWGQNLGETNLWMGLTNVLVINSGVFHHLAIIGDGWPSSPFAISDYEFGNGMFTIAQPMARGPCYGLEFKNSFAETSWQMLPPIFGNDTIQFLKDPGAVADQRFYRIRLRR